MNYTSPSNNMVSCKVLHNNNTRVFKKKKFKNIPKTENVRKVIIDLTRTSCVPSKISHEYELYIYIYTYYSYDVIREYRSDLFSQNLEKRSNIDGENGHMRNASS